MKIENNSFLGEMTSKLIQRLAVAAAHSASRFMTEMKEAVCTHHCWCLLLLISKELSLQGIFMFYLYYYNYYYIIYNLSVLVLVLCLFCCFLSGHIPKVLFCEEKLSELYFIIVSTLIWGWGCRPNVSIPNLSTYCFWLLTLTFLLFIYWKGIQYITCAKSK